MADSIHNEHAPRSKVEPPLTLSAEQLEAVAAGTAASVEAIAGSGRLHGYAPADE